MRREWSEEDIRVRPSRKGSRPRSKLRPKHEDAEVGMVTTVDRGRYDVVLDNGTQVRCVRARELRRTAIVVGDRVDVVGDTSGAPDTLARIVRIHERATVLRRSADDADLTERVMIAGADLLVIVVAVTDPDPSTRMIDRFLVAAFDAGMDALLCLTKTDLADAGPLRELYGELDVPAVATAVREGEVAGLGELSAHLEGRTAVLVGSSGVGKSTLVNALIPEADRATGGVNIVTGRGRHTSTSAQALPFGEGWIIDTPGIRSFGLAHIDPQRIVAGFEDIAAAAAERCPRGCTHLDEYCELGGWAEEAGPAAVARLDSLRRLLVSRDALEEY